MLWYILFPIFVFIVATSYNKKKWTGLILMLILLFFSMFRGSQVGTDTAGYIDRVDKISELFLYDANFNFEGGRTELLYYHLCSFIYLNGYSSRWIIYIFSIITFIFLYLGCIRHKINTSLFLLFYVLTTSYIISFNVARQFAAISICFFASSFLIESNWKKYLFLVFILVASLIHSSSIVLVVLFFSNMLKLDRGKWGIGLYVFALISVFLPLTNLALDLLSHLNMLSRYSESYGLGGTYSSSDNGMLNYFFKPVIFTIYFLIYKARTKEKTTDIWDIFFLAFFFVQAIFATEGNVATYRIKFAFMPLLCGFFAICFKSMNKEKVPLFYLYCLIGYAMCVRMSLGYYPYYLQFN